jgi:hypothetical protein
MRKVDSDKIRARLEREDKQKSLDVLKSVRDDPSATPADKVRATTALLDRYDANASDERTIAIDIPSKEMIAKIYAKRKSD